MIIFSPFFILFYTTCYYKEFLVGRKVQGKILIESKWIQELILKNTAIWKMTIKHILLQQEF